MDTGDVALLVIAGYVAVTTLVRLMLRHRDQLLGRLRSQMTVEKAKSRQVKRQQDKAA